jgi:hypothetical protein
MCDQVYLCAMSCVRRWISEPAPEGTIGCDLTPEFSCEGAGLEPWMGRESCATSSAATIR